MNKERLLLAAEVMRDLQKVTPSSAMASAVFWSTVLHYGGKKGITFITTPAVLLARDDRIKAAGLHLDAGGFPTFGPHVEHPMKSLAAFFEMPETYAYTLFHAQRGEVEGDRLSFEVFATDFEYLAAHEEMPPELQTLYAADVFPEHYVEHLRSLRMAAMTRDEYASFLLGDALRRAMLDATSPADARAKAWATYSTLLQDALPESQAKEVRAITGLVDLSQSWLPEALRYGLPA